MPGHSPPSGGPDSCMHCEEKSGQFRSENQPTCVGITRDVGLERGKQRSRDSRTDGVQAISRERLDYGPLRVKQRRRVASGIVL